MSTLFRRFWSRPFVAVAALTVLTLAVIGTVILTVTTAGCGLTRSAPRCAAQTPTARLGSPSPSEIPSPSPITTAVPTVAPITPPTIPTASAPLPPNFNPASGVPFYPPTSSGGSSPYLPHPISCSLPVVAGGPGSGGFITFPGGTFIADPKSNVTLPSPPGAASPPPGPGYGFAGMSYDRAYSKWVPVPHSWLSPDGGHYAFPGNSVVDVVAVSSGAITELAKGHPWQVVTMANDGVYASLVGSGGLFFLPLAGGFTQITAGGYWQIVGGGAAYGTATSAVPAGATSTILRLDLSTGTTTDWFSRSGLQSSAVGFDREFHPIIYATTGQGPMSAWLATGPGTAIPLVNGSYFGFAGVVGTPIADANGVWFSAYGYAAQGAHIVLYTGSAFYGMSSFGASIAGGCS